MGKRKIAIEEIRDDRLRRSVTFTKRRDGLFKKAETACQKFGGLQIGIVAFSPAGKPFTFCNSSSVSSVDAIINTYMSSKFNSSGSAEEMVMGKRRSRSDDDDDDLQVIIETEKKKKKQKTMNPVVTPPSPCITVEVEEEGEKLDQGFHWDHHQELRNNEFIMGYGENAGIVVTEVESSQFLVEGESSHNWAAPDVDQLQEIIHIEDDDDFEYADHCDEETTTMGLLPPPQTTTTTTTTSTSLCNSDVNEDEVGGAYEDDIGFTLEEWENIFNSSPTSVVANSSTFSSSCSMINQDDSWPTQEFLHLLCS